VPSSRRRLAIFVVLAAACAAAAVAAVAAGLRSDGQPAGAGAASALADAEAAGRPVVVFRTVESEPSQPAGRIAVAGLDPSPASPATLPRSCDRVHFAAGTGLCLARGDGFASGYRAIVFDSDLGVRQELDLAGIPSRARVSPDGARGTVTMFVTGHTYAEAGTFSTETTLIDLERGESLGDLEEFTVTRAGEQVTAVDRNFWGVTFAAGGDRFYATMATGGRTYLIRGSVARRAARVIRENVECPSLSPDGSRIAFKKRVGSGAGPWRLAVLDLATMEETLLSETRSIDDQAEWLDDERVLYGIDGDVWVAHADGGGEPSRFIDGAESPAVVRW